MGIGVFKNEARSSRSTRSRNGAKSGTKSGTKGVDGIDSKAEMDVALEIDLDVDVDGRSELNLDVTCLGMGTPLEGDPCIVKSAQLVK